MGRKALLALAAVAIAMAVFFWRSGGRITQPGSMRASLSSVLSGDDALQQKLQPFIQCINKTDSSLQQSSELYMETVRSASKYSNPKYNRAADHSANFRFIGFSPYEQHNEISLGCADGLEKAVAAAPASPELDRIGKDYATTLRQLIPLFNEIDRYYGQKNYEDDHFQRGRALHEQVTPLLRHLLSLSGPLREEVGTQNDAIQQRRLDAAAKAGDKDFGWHTMNFMLQARRSMNELDRALAKGRVDEATLAAIEKPVQDAFDAAEAYGVAHPSEKGKYGNNPLWFGLKVHAEIFLTRFKQLRRDIGNHEPGKTFDRDREYLVGTFNSLVDVYNTMHPL